MKIDQHHSNTFIIDIQILTFFYFVFREYVIVLKLISVIQKVYLLKY